MTDYTESRSIIEVLRSRIAASGADGFGVVSRVPIADLKALIDAAERTEKADAERDEAVGWHAHQEAEIQRLGNLLQAAQAEITRLQSLVDEAAGVLENWLVVGNDMAARRSIRTRAASFLTRLRAQPNITPDKDT